MNSTHKQQQQPQHLFKQKLTWLLRKRRKRSDSGHHTTNWSITLKPTVSSAAVMDGEEEENDNVISQQQQQPIPPPTPPAIHHHQPCYPRSIASSITSSSSSSSIHSRRRSLSLRSACSGISNLSARVQHFHIGTPASYFPKPESMASLPRSQQQRPSSQCEAHLTVPSIRSTTSETTTTRSWRRRRERLLLAIDQQSLPDFETQAFCSTCEKYVQSRIRYRTGALTWLIAFIL